MPNRNTIQKCSQCGSPLILINKVTELIEGSRFPQTTFTYICSNKECQDKRDRETAKRIKLQKDKEGADKVRQERKLENKKNFAAKIETFSRGLKKAA